MLVIATRNPHKVGEIRGILGPRFECETLDQFPAAPVIEEDAATFAGNARKKAVGLAKWLSLTPFEIDPVGISPKFVLADDSGLEVDALNGAPGVHSARFAAREKKMPANSPDGENLAKLLRLLQDVPSEHRTARFRCVLALTPVAVNLSENEMIVAAELEKQTQLFEGVCDGRIDFAPHGEGGFGYDPVFIPTGYEETFAELGDLAKNKLSHRAKALGALKSALKA